MTVMGGGGENGRSGLERPDNIFAVRSAMCDERCESLMIVSRGLL